MRGFHINLGYSSSGGDIVECDSYINPEKHKVVSGYIHRYLCFGDYIGSLVEKSNVKAFDEEFASVRDRLYTIWFGYSGSEGIAMPNNIEDVPYLTEGEREIWNDIQDSIKRLENYPLLDEDLHSAMEWGQAYESIELFMIHDLKNASRRHFNGDEKFEEWLDSWLTKDQFIKLIHKYDLIWNSEDCINGYWSMNGGKTEVDGIFYQDFDEWFIRRIRKDFYNVI